ncbi:hypothetical protein M8J75_005321 [Diaphorina citri]|nr:hypothetical protein M8J75_005321 [Diaphorina citri]
MNIEPKDSCGLREWLSLSNLLKFIPNKIRRGLIMQDVHFTCIDVANEFIAIGTNVGIVFWCNRITLKVTQYKPEKGDLGISCLKLVPSVDYMLAVGDKSGIISIFKIPKELPKDLPEEYLRRYDSKTEVFTVGGIHKTQITALEWSLNGEKLFSGDSEGVVGFTQMDFYMNLTKSCEISNERYRIVQLSFNNNQILLVSSLYRSVILYKNENWKVLQIGQKDRKTLAELGAVFNIKTCTSASPPLIYATRHGQRIWIADTSGVVQRTLLFKDLLASSDIPRIKLLNSFEGALNCGNFEFSTLDVLNDKYLVSHSSNILVVIDPDSSAVVGVLRSYSGIHSVAMGKDEIFMVEGSRGVRRLGFCQDPYAGRQNSAESDVLGDAMLDLALRIKDAATVIAPLLKDYTEATPASRLNSPEVDYDVGIACEVEDIPHEKPDVLEEMPSTSCDVPSVQSPNQTEINISEPRQTAAVSGEPNGTDQVVRDMITEAHSGLKMNAESSKESSGVLSRRQILKDIGTKEYGDLIFSSSRKTRKTNKGPRRKLGNPTSNSLLSSGATGSSTTELDSDSASIMSEVDSLSAMTLSQTSSNSEFELTTPALTNEELESKVAKMLSLEEVLINPPPLTKAIVPPEEEDHSRLKLNFVDCSLSNASRTSDLTIHSSVSTHTLPNTQDIPIPGSEDVKVIESGEQVVLNFDHEHFGEGDQDLKTHSNLSASSGNKNNVESESNQGKPPHETEDIREQPQSNSDVYNHNPSRSEKSNSIEPVSETQIITKLSTNSGNETQPSSKPEDTQPDGNNRVEDANTITKLEDSLLEETSLDSDMTNIVIINSSQDLGEEDNTNTSEAVYGDTTDYKDKPDRTTDTLGKNLPDLLTSVDKNTNPNGIQNGACDCDCRNDTAASDKLKGYLGTLDQGWQCCITPNTCVWLGVTCHKIYCGGPRLSVYEADLTETSLQWDLMNQKATCMTVSPCNRFTWRSNLGVVSSLLPSGGDDWKLCARDIDSMSLTQSLAWYCAQGKVYTQRLPLSSVTLVPCSLHIVKVSSVEDRVWVLSDAGQILTRDNITADNPTGDSWSKMDVPADVHISDIALTHNRLGWIVDRSNYIYFYLPSRPASSTRGGECHLPSPSSSTSGGEWWQLLIHGNFEHVTLHSASAQKPCIRSNRESIWITHPLASVVYVNTSSVWGHKWTAMELGPLDPVCDHGKVSPGPGPVKWRKISAEGLFEEDGYIWFLTSEGELYNYCPYSRALSSVPSPIEEGQDDSVVSIESSPNALWVLTEKCHIYIRLGISTLHPTGVKWKPLLLEQFSSSHVQVGDLSCACDVVWVCSTRGNVYMTVYPPHEEREQVPAWIPAEGSALPGCHFSRIFVGPHAGMVWALDNKGNVYVREGIYHDYQLGVNWLYVPGLQATHITISQSGVWALARDTVYQRVGVSPTNFIGQYWQSVPGRVNLLSASLDNQLYGAFNGVVRHSSVEYSHANVKFQ